MIFNYSAIKGNYNLLWHEFKQAFIAAVSKTDFSEAWTTNSKRTKLYFENLLPNVAKFIGLKYAPEMKFRVDGTFYVESGQGAVRVPIVQVESENDAKSSDDEVYKLCALNVPLKVLLICNEWNEATKVDLSEGYWNYIIESFAEESDLTGYLAIIVAEMKETLKFYSYVYDEKGQFIPNEDMLLVEVISGLQK